MGEPAGDVSPAEPLHVVGLSGGKDSVAMAIALAENEPRDYTYIYNGTGNELPAMQAHIASLEKRLGKPVLHVGAGMDLYQLILELKMLPNFRARFCTRILKIEPTIEFFEKLPPDSVLYVGLRADEEERRGLYGEDIRVRFPLRELGWGLAEVWQFLNDRGITIPKRTDCGVCPYQRLGEWWDLWKHHPQEFARGAFVEDLFDHTFRSAQRDTWPAALHDLAAEFSKGRVPRGANEEGVDYANPGEPCRVCRL